MFFQNLKTFLFNGKEQKKILNIHMLGYYNGKDLNLLYLAMMLRGDYRKVNMLWESILGLYMEVN